MCGHWREPHKSTDTLISRAVYYKAFSVLVWIPHVSIFRVLLWQIRQAPAAITSTALHRPQVSGALVLLQAHRRHAYWHLPHGDARSPSSNDIIAERAELSSPLLSSPHVSHQPGSGAGSFFKKIPTPARDRWHDDFERRSSPILSSLPFPSGYLWCVSKQWIHHVYGSVLYLVKIYK